MPILALPRPVARTLPSYASRRYEYHRAGPCRERTIPFCRLCFSSCVKVTSRLLLVTGHTTHYRSPHLLRDLPIGPKLVNPLYLAKSRIAFIPCQIQFLPNATFT